VDICFDTSAFNALCDDPDRGVISQRIRQSHRILISSVNIVEVVATPDPSRRRALLECMRDVWDQTRPLVMPNKLVRRATRAFARPSSKVMLTITGEDAPFWHLLEDPNSAGPTEQVEALTWKESLEAPFKDAHREGRASFQQLFGRDPVLRPRSVSDLIRFFMDLNKGGEAMYGLVRGIFKKETGQFLSRDAMWRLFLMVPHCRSTCPGGATKCSCEPFASLTTAQRESLEPSTCGVQSTCRTATRWSPTTKASTER
jgi:hypothetical protein